MLFHECANHSDNETSRQTEAGKLTDNKLTRYQFTRLRKASLCNGIMPGVPTIVYRYEILLSRRSVRANINTDLY